MYWQFFSKKWKFQRTCLQIFQTIENYGKYAQIFQKNINFGKCADEFCKEVYISENVLTNFHKK